MTKAANLVALGLKNRVAVISVNGTHFLEYACIFLALLLCHLVSL